MISKTSIDKWERKMGHSTDPYVQMGIKWLKGEIVIKEFNGIKLTPKQIEFVNDKSPELLMSGGYRCLHEDSLIYNADTGKEERIKDIKTPFKVLSREFGQTKKAQAMTPVLIGNDELIKITHDKGSFIAHKDHLVLTGSGYLKTRALQVGDHLTYSEIPDETISESYLSRLFVGALNLTQRFLGSLVGCFSYLHQYGAPLLRGVGSVLNVLLLPIYALAHNRFVKKGVSYISQGYNRLYRWFFHPSKNHVDVGHHAFSSVGRIFVLSFEHTWHLIQAFFQFLRMFYHRLIADGFFVFCPYLNPTTKVKKIEIIRGNYYDLHVIGTHNYYSGGVFHHNCGKTVGLAIKLWLICMWFPKNQILLGRKSRTDLDSTTLPTMFEMFPSGSYEYRVGPGIITFPNGSLIHCKGLDTDAGGDDTKKASQKIKGMTLGGVALDQLEEISKNMYTDVSGRLTIDIPYRPIFATTNPATFWAYPYFKGDPAPGTKLIETGMMDNKENLPEGFIEGQMTKPKSYVDRFVLGIWDPTNIQEGRVFPDDHLSDAWCKEPKRVINGIKIFEEPRNTKYQLGIDPSTGADDPCHMVMIDTVSGEEVANFHGHVPVQVQIEAAHRMCVMYSVNEDVLAIPEVNGVGQAFIEGFKKLWNTIYIREVYSKREKKKTDKLGWYSSFANKTQIIEHFKELLTYQFPKIKDRETLREFQMFVYTDEAKKHGASCPHPYHDDRVMATLFAYVDTTPKAHTVSDEEEFILYSNDLL